MTRRLLIVGFLVGMVTVLALSLPLARTAYAQAQLANASLTGQIVDESGAAIPGAELSLQNKAGGQPQNTTSNEAGYYRFAFVRPDRYTLAVKKTGFADLVVSEITLQVQQTANVGVTMKLGTLAQEVTVSAASVALETQTSSLGGVVSEDVTTQLPLIMRDPTVLVNLVPGVVADHRQTTATDSSGVSYQGRLDFSINGGYRSQAVALVDGVDVSATHGSFSSIPIQPTPDFTQEFKVQTNNLSAEFGRGAGVISLVTKSGTNTLHGAVFGFVQNDNLNANDLFSNRQGAKKPESKRAQYGFAVGGPIRKDKTFFFFNYEQLEQRRALPIRTRVPTAAERAGVFSGIFALDGTPVVIYNPADTFVDSADGRTKRRPFLNNTITGPLNAFGTSLLDFFPDPNNPGLLGPGGQFTGTNNFQLSGSAPLTFDRWDAKIDHNLGNAHRFMGRYSSSRYRVIPLDVFGNAASSQGLSTRDNEQPGHNAVISWVVTASPTLVIQQAVSWSRITDDSNQAEFDPTSLGGPFADGRIAAYANEFGGGAAFPSIGISGYAPMGNGPGQNFKQPYSNYGYSLGVVKTAGQHTIKAGFQYTLLQASEDLRKGYGGVFNFTNRWTCGPDPLNCTANTGNGVADLLLGLPGSGSMNAGFTSLYESTYIATYFQDDWRVTPKLTLNLGLRFDFVTPFSERFDHNFRFDLGRANPLGNAIGPNTGGQSLDQFFVGLGSRPLTGGVIFPSTPGVEGRGMIPTDYNLAPRIGFAYQLTKKLVMRGGLSKLYMLSPASPGPSTPGNGPYGASTSIIASIDGINPNVTIDDPFPSGFNVPTYDRDGLHTLIGDQMWAGSTGQKTPYQWQWNFGFQYEMASSSVLSVAYAGSRGHRLTCAFFFCGDQIPRDLVQRYGQSIFDTVPNPFFGIITNPRAPLSAPTIQFGNLLKQWAAYSSVVPILPPPQGPDAEGDTFQNAFDSLQIQLTHRFRGGLTALVAYTASKNITNTDSFEAGYLGPSVGYQNNVDYQGERSLSAEDIPQKLVIGHVFDLPFGKGKRFGATWNSVFDKVLGHWQVSGMTTYYSGYPLSIGIAGHNTGGFGGGARPNRIGSGCLGSGRSRGERILQYADEAAFTKPPDLEFGNASRLLNCRGDGVMNFDISLGKFIPITERVNIEFRTEFYNAFNRARLSAPNMTVDSGSFGQVFGQHNAPRIIQFGLKVNF